MMGGIIMTLREEYKEESEYRVKEWNGVGFTESYVKWLEDKVNNSEPIKYVFPDEDVLLGANNMKE